MQHQSAQDGGCRWSGCSKRGTPLFVQTVWKKGIVAFDFKLIVCIFLISIPWSDYNIGNFFFFSSAAFLFFAEAKLLMNLKQLLHRISSANEKTEKIAIIS